MQSCQYYIDDIQSAVYSPETADPTFLRDAAAQYAEACAEANHRLRQVAQLLRRGLRSEALQMTEEEPNLLDCIQMLDFPELPAWRDLLKRWGMVPPPPLLIDLASDINQAYADHQPLESLLKQHRLLALARAPLAARVRTLRQIRRADTGNAAWEEDLRILESARIKQLDREIETAHRCDDLDALSAIKEEFSKSDWLISPPSNLRQKVERLHQVLSAKLARTELEQIEKELNAAHMAFDVERGFALQQRWNELATIASLPLTDPLAERAAPALEWLAEEERRRTEREKRRSAIAALEQALDDTAPAEDLARLYEATLLFDEPIPSALTHRVEQRIASHALAAQRRHRIILASILFTTLLVGGLITYFIIQQRHIALVSGVVDTLTSMIDNGRLQEAQTTYEQAVATTPGMAFEPEVQAQKSRIDGAVNAEHDRRAAFANAIERARNAPPTNPDLAALAEANRLGKTTEERQSVAQIESQIAAAEDRIREEQDAAISKGLAEFRKRLSNYESMNRANLADGGTNLSKLAEDIERTKNQFPKASPAMFAQFDPLLRRISAIRQGIKQQSKQAQSKTAITDSVGRLDAYKSALQAFARQFPDSELAGNLALLNQESQVWAGFAAWNELLESLLRDTDAWTPTEARRRIAAGEVLQKNHSDIYLAERFESLKSYLESVAYREPPDGPPIIEELRKLFRDPLVGNLWMVQQKDGLRFYSRHEPTRNGTIVRFDYLAGFDLSEKPQSLRMADIVYNDRAPQSILATRFAPLMKDAAPRDWEKNFAAMLGSIVGDKNLDPILKIALLERVLKVGMSGSSALADAFAQYKQELENSKVDLSVSWMDPRNDTAQAERRRADVLVDGLPPIAEAIRVAAANYKRLREPMDFHYSWIGWLWRDPKDSWHVITGSALPDSGEIVVITKSAGKTAEPVKIGDVNSHEVQLIEGSSASLLVGRPVFVRTKVGN